MPAPDWVKDWGSWGCCGRGGKAPRGAKESPLSRGWGQEGAAGYQEENKHPGRGQGFRPMPVEGRRGQSW